MKPKSIIPLVTMGLGAFWVIYGMVNPSHGFWHPIRGPVSGFLPILIAIPLVPVSTVAFIRSFKEQDNQGSLESWSIVLAAAIVFFLAFIVGMVISLMVFVFV